MVAVRTGLTTPPPMPGMPAPMQPMGGLPPMLPMGGPGTFPAAPLPAGQTPVPASVPPMPLAGFPPPPMRPPMAQPPMPQKGSNAPRRKRFGDSLEGMLGRNMFAPQQQRPLPMPPQMMQQRMVAPRTPMMRTPTPRPMNQGGIVQYMEEGGLKLGSGGFGGHSSTYGIERARDSEGNLVPGMFVAKYADGTYSKPVTASNVEGLRQGLLSGNVTSGDYTASEASDMASKNLYLRSGDVAVTDADVSGGFGSPLGMSNEMLGNDTVFVNFGDGTAVTAQKGMVDAMNEYGLLEGMGTRSDFNRMMRAISAASVRDPESDLGKAHSLFNEKQIAYNEALKASNPNIQKNIDAFRGYYAPAPEPETEPAPTGADAGPGSAVAAPDNFGTGAYTPAPVDPSELNPIDYTQFTGDVGNFSGTPESGALFGPKINIPRSVSQYYTSPVTGKLTTTAGPEMVATSPIGAIKLPARPVDIDIFDFLSTPTYGSLLVDEAEEMAMGGVVPRQTTIAGQPHGLAYINQDEEALLRSFGGSGIMGPGGIPSYPPVESGYSAGMGSGYTTGTGSSNFDSGYKPSSKRETLAQRLRRERREAEQAIRDAEASIQETPSGKMDFGDEDYTPTSDALNAQLSLAGKTNITDDIFPVNFGATSSGKDFKTAAQADTDVSGAEFVAAGGLGTGDLGVSYMPEPVTLGSDDPVVFTDIMGNTYSNAADRDRANLGYQQASYQQGNMPVRMLSEGFRQFGDFGSDEEANRRAAANYATDPTPPSAYNFQETPDIFTSMFPPQRPILPPKISDDDDTDDKTTSDDGTSRVSNLLELEPAEGGYSLVDLKKGISLAEGTSDAGGYDRLLGYQEDNFNVKPTEMTVQEIIDFQDSEGPYAEYSRAINKKLGKVNPDGTGVISTPVGKYQIVGSTMKGLIRAGVLDPNEKFNVNAQERAANHLITKDLFIEDPDTKKKTYNIGLKDVKTGNITSDQFEEALINQFEGLGDKNLDDLINKANEGDAPGVIPASATSNIQLESGPATETNIFDPIDPQDKGKEKEYQFNLNLGGSDKEKDKNKELPPFIPAEKVEQITSYTDKNGKTTVDNPKTPQNEAVIAQLGLGSSLADVAATGRDIGVPNAAEAAFLMEALNEMEFDDKGNLVGAEPNFLEETLGKVIRNLTLGAFDPNDPQKREDALAILDNYQKTGKFVYDGKEMSLTELIKASKDEGIEPAVIGVEGPDGKIVGFDDGTGFRNIMGDYDPVYKDGQVFSGGSDTQNIKTGSTDIFGGNTNTTNTATEITTGGGSDTTEGPDTGHTVTEDGTIVCNTPGYIYNPETKVCEPPKEEEDKDPTINVVRGEDFDDVLKRVVVAAPDVAPISANVRPMQEGGMAGLNRAADNFLQALAG